MDFFSDHAVLFALVCAGIAIAYGIGLGGVLIVGPNRTFIRYIGQVLPSLGEQSVEQREIDALISRPHREISESRELATLKGSGRMAEVLERLLWSRMREPEEDLVLRVGRGRVVVTAADIPGKNLVRLIVDDQPYLAADVVNHPEEPVVLIAHPDRARADEARRRVTIEPGARSSSGGAPRPSAFPSGCSSTSARPPRPWPPIAPRGPLIWPPAPAHCSPSVATS